MHRNTSSNAWLTARLAGGSPFLPGGTWSGTLYQLEVGGFQLMDREA